MVVLKSFAKIYLVLGAVLGLLTGISYVTMPFKLAFQGCYGLVDFFVAQITGVIFGVAFYIAQLFAWPYFTYKAITENYGWLHWLFPGWSSYCS